MSVPLLLLAAPQLGDQNFDVGALAWIGFEVQFVGALHPINALLIIGLAGRIAYTEFRTSEPAPAPVPETSPT